MAIVMSINFEEDCVLVNTANRKPAAHSSYVEVMEFTKEDVEASSRISDHTEGQKYAAKSSMHFGTSYDYATKAVEETPSLFANAFKLGAQLGFVGGQMATVIKYSADTLAAVNAARQIAEVSCTAQNAWGYIASAGGYFWNHKPLSAPAPTFYEKALGTVASFTIAEPLITAAVVTAINIAVNPAPLKNTIGSVAEIVTDSFHATKHAAEGLWDLGCATTLDAGENLFDTLGCVNDYALEYAQENLVTPILGIVPDII